MCDNRSPKRMRLDLSSRLSTPLPGSTSPASDIPTPAYILSSALASLEHPSSQSEHASSEMEHSNPQTGSGNEAPEPESPIMYGSDSSDTVSTSVVSESIRYEDGVRVLEQLNSLIESEHLMVSPGMSLRLNEQNLPEIVLSVSQERLSQISGLISGTQTISTHWKRTLRIFPGPHHPDPDALAPITHSELEEVLNEADMVTKKNHKELMEISNHFRFGCVMNAGSLSRLAKVPQLVCQLWGVQSDDELDSDGYWSDDLATRIYDQSFKCYTELDRIHREMKMCEKDKSRNGPATFRLAIQRLVLSVELCRQLNFANSDAFKGLSERAAQIKQGNKSPSPTE